MRSIPRRLLGVATVVAAFAVAPSARAFDEDASIGMDTPVASRTKLAGTMELSGNVGYMSAPIRGGTNPFGFGYGGRFGYSLSGFYVGAGITNFVGGTDVGSSENALLYGAEIGYGVTIPIVSNLVLTLRPVVGAGGMTLTRTDPPVVTAVPLATATTSRVPKVVTAPDVISSASGSSGGGGGSSGGVSGSTGAGSSGSSSSGSSTSTPSNTTTLTSGYIQPGFVAMFGSETYFAAIDTSALILPSIVYGGTEPTMWISYGVSARLGVSW